MTLEQIENKKMELVQIQIQYKKDIEEMQWQYIKENFNLEKGNVVKYKDKYCVIDSISMFSRYTTYLRCLVIKKDTTIGKNTVDGNTREYIKEFNSYEDYRKTLDNL